MKIFAIAFFSILLLPDFYISFTFLKKKKWYWKLLHFLPTLLAIVCACLFWGGIPTLIFSKTFFYILICLALPKFSFSCISILFRIVGIFWKRVKRWELLGALVGGIITLGIMIYGCTFGQRHIVLHEETLSFSNLPEEFDGYRIVQISDLHIGTYGADTTFPSQIVEKVQELKPDLIVFTGDLVNSGAQEIVPFQTLLSSLSAPDGVFSVLGNHDYCYYNHHHQKEVIQRELQNVIRTERAMGWTLLRNENRVIRRNRAEIAIIGVENVGRPPFPCKGDINKARIGLNDSIFSILLSHDPSHWQMEILPQTDIPLMLSGHTHAMQFRIGNLSPVMLKYPEWSGVYEQDGQNLFVSTGVGGGIPFRFGAWAEICIITLRRG